MKSSHLAGDVTVVGYDGRSLIGIQHMGVPPRRGGEAGSCYPREHEHASAPRYLKLWPYRQCALQTWVN